MRKLRTFVALCVAAALWPATVQAQEAATVTGRVTRDGGAPVPSAAVRIAGSSVGTVTGEDGSYRLTVPAARLRAGQQVQITASQVGLASQTRTVTLAPGATLTENFQLTADLLQLEGLVVTGAGTTTTRERLGVSISSVSGEEVNRVPTANVVAALAAKAPGVQVATSSGEPGASANIRIRGVKSFGSFNTQPLFVVDGIPINNQENALPSTVRTTDGTSEEPVGLSGAMTTNRAIDLNPQDIESVEILKGASASAIYGARAANGVVLITTKRGITGPTRVTFNTTMSVDQVSSGVPLQRTWAQGINGRSGVNLRSWGARVEGETWDHWGELFEQGRVTDSNLSLSGGSERTTYFLSLGRLDHNGVITGDNDFFERTTARLRGSHQIAPALVVNGNFAYSQSSGGFTQKGSNVSGLLLGGLRTPPNFNNCVAGACYLNEQGLQRTYLTPNAAEIGDLAGFDNPFWVINENTTRSDVGRAFGNVALDYRPTDWLSLNYTLGTDYSTDDRHEVLPQGNQSYAGGYVGEATFIFQSIDHNATASVERQLRKGIGTSWTLGWNRNSRDSRRMYVEGYDLVAPNLYTLDNAITRVPDNYDYKINSESYFGQGQVDLFDQLFLTGALRNDGFSTFGESEKRHWYPKASAAWTFSRALGLPEDGFLSHGKLRAAWGQAGNEPPVYGTIPGLTAADILDAGWGSLFRTTNYGRGGVYSSITQAQPDLKPERTTETEVGLDLSILRDLATLGVTYYDARTEDAILQAPLAPSSGYFQQLQNAATIRNRGVELSLDLRPVRARSFGWEVGVVWATNDNEVLSLGDSTRQFIRVFGGFASAIGAAVVGHPIGVLQGNDFARCGVDQSDAVVQGCQGAPKGALYIGANGFPVLDPETRVIADPNPDWTAGIRNIFTLPAGLQVSTLVDVSRGGDLWNGTRGALYSYGTHKDNEVRATCTNPATNQCTGNEKVFGRGILPGPVAGPGAGKSVPIGENWWRTGLGTSFNGVNTPFVEDASYVKLREVALTYSVPANVTRRFGMGGVDLRLAGRNLKTWTDYTGIDPETNVAGGVTQRGVDYFNNPQTRQWTLSVGLTR